MLQVVEIYLLRRVPFEDCGFQILKGNLYVQFCLESEWRHFQLSRQAHFSTTRKFTTLKYSIWFDKVYNSMLPSVVENQHPKNGKRIPVRLKKLVFHQSKTKLSLGNTRSSLICLFINTHFYRKKVLCSTNVPGMFVNLDQKILFTKCNI